MAFILKSEEEIRALASETGEFTHEATGIKFKLRSFADRGYQAAYAQLHARDRAFIEEVVNRPLDGNFFDGITADAKTPNELWMRAIGRYLIAEWDVLDHNEQPLEVNDDNFILLVNQVDDPSELVSWCLSRATDIAISRDEDQAEIKKKSLTATSGKGTTAKPTRKPQKSPTTSA